jgi:hypothetical protein
MEQLPINQWNSREVMLRRASYLFIGLAIGMFMLGFLQMARRSQQAQSPQAPVPPNAQTPGPAAPNVPAP